MIEWSFEDKCFVKRVFDDGNNKKLGDFFDL